MKLGEGSAHAAIPSAAVLMLCDALQGLEVYREFRLNASSQD
jgi:hypothetical protein